LIKKVSATDAYNLAVNGMFLEGERFAEIARLPNFNELLKETTGYLHDLSQSKDNRFEIFSQLVSAQGPVEINLSDATQATEQLINIANLLSIPVLFSGWTLTLDSISKLALAQLIQKAISQLSPDKLQVSQILSSKLNYADTIRVIHIIRLLGLPLPFSRHCDQLSIAASGGTRDRIAMHLVPQITRGTPGSALMAQTQPQTLSFNILESSPRHVVLIDSDSGLAERYRKLNDDADQPVVALNADISAGLAETQSLISSNTISPRNTIIGFRIDHEMITDADSFISQLAQVITEKATLLLTIGSGHDNSELSGRIRVMKQLQNSLSSKGLRPVHIKCHKGENIEEIRRHPIFGAPSYATYEIIYCELDRETLIENAS
jgi:hypothetical protein